MPGAARDLGVDANAPSANLEGGERYLRQQLDRFGGNLQKALAAYNAGPAGWFRPTAYLPSARRNYMSLQSSGGFRRQCGNMTLSSSSVSLGVVTMPPG